MNENRNWVDQNSIWINQSLNYSLNPKCLCHNSQLFTAVKFGFHSVRALYLHTMNAKKTKIMIFRNRGRSPNLKFNWDGKPLEIVNNFTYFGVLFTAKLSKKATLNNSIKKAKFALNNLFLIFYKGKLKTFEARIKLFNSLVRSVLFYAMPIWGLQFLHDFEKFETCFLRKIFCLPNLVPRWAINIETVHKTIRSYFYGAVLNFLARILTKPETHPVRQCYDALMDLKAKHNSIENWCQQMENIMKTIKAENVWNSQDADQLYRSKSLILEKLRQGEINDYVNLMLGTSKYKHLKHVKNKVITEKYLNSSNWWETRGVRRRITPSSTRFFGQNFTPSPSIILIDASTRRRVDAPSIRNHRRGIFK